MRKGQILVATALMITVVIMAIVVSVYEAHVFFLKTRSIVVREVIGSITADFERATAVVLAAATRSYFNYSRFYDFCSRFSNLGLTYGARHNFTIARNVAKSYLQYWLVAASKAYASYGPQIKYDIGRLNISKYLGRKRYIYNLVSGYWYYPTAASVAYAKLRVNLTNAGFYGWESDIVVGVFLKVYSQPIDSDPIENYTKITINVRVDNNESYSELITKGWVEIYYPERKNGRWTGKWVKGKIEDIKYDGFGNYTIKFKPYVKTLEDSITGKEYVPLLVVVSDHRGIIVEALTYTRIVFKVSKKTPDQLIYYDYNGRKKTVTKPNQTPQEKYTIEFSSDLNFYWLNIELGRDPADFELPPLPYMPIKQLMINISKDGTLQTLSERPFQVENWTRITWNGENIWIPYGLPDPTIDIVPYIVMGGKYYNMRFVFQVPFESRNVRDQWVVIWWNDSLDAKIRTYSTKIWYDESKREVFHPLFGIEFLDLQHQRAWGFESVPISNNPCSSYFDPDYHLKYWGIAALVIRDPVSGTVYGIYNLHGFDSWIVRCGRSYIAYLARYRPYGTWKIYHNYSRFGITAPIRIYAVLNTTLVGDIYRLTESNGNTAGNVRDDYYHFLAIVEIINGTNYVPIISYVYWTNTRTGRGYWVAQASGAASSTIPNWQSTFGWFTYLTYREGGYQENSTDDTPVSSSMGYNVYESYYPGIMVSQWGDDAGKSLIFNKAILDYWYSLNPYRNLKTASYMCGSVPLCSADFQVFPFDWYDTYTIGAGTRFSYWSVYFVYDLTGPGWRGDTDENGWRNSYVYAPMFLEEYSPVIKKP
ncbi:MAG: hypothetical protein DRJ35_02280 [Thermoprotei archaeon]|nr:MAG: hypothetical protein DRJ35_02280 [Thermoprotei archaeon]